MTIRIPPKYCDYGDFINWDGVNSRALEIGYLVGAYRFYLNLRNLRRRRMTDPDADFHDLGEIECCIDECGVA